MNDRILGILIAVMALAFFASATQVGALWRSSLVERTGHTASAGKPVEGKLTTPKWERRLARLQNSLYRGPRRDSRRPPPVGP